MTKGLIVPDYAADLQQYHGVVDDFIARDTTQWGAVISDLGAVAATNTVGGVVQVQPSDGTVADNDESYLTSVQNTFLIANQKPLYFEARVQYAEAATNQANIMVGLMNTVAADSLRDNGLGPRTNFSGAVIYKVDLETVWRCAYSDGTTQNIVQLTAANSVNKVAYTAGGAAYVRLGIEIVPYSATRCDVMFYIDGALVLKMKDQTYASAALMQAVAGVKNGSTTTEALNVDYIWCYQKR